MLRLRVGGAILVIAFAAQAGRAVATPGAGGPVSRSRVLASMRNVGWSTVSGSSQMTVLGATDGHAAVQLRFLVSVAAARASLPSFVPLGVGWQRNVSFVFAGQPTFGDELALENCIYYG